MWNNVLLPHEPENELYDQNIQNNKQSLFQNMVVAVLCMEIVFFGRKRVCRKMDGTKLCDPEKNEAAKDFTIRQTFTFLPENRYFSNDLVRSMSAFFRLFPLGE